MYVLHFLLFIIVVIKYITNGDHLKFENIIFPLTVLIKCTRDLSYIGIEKQGINTLQVPRNHYNIIYWKRPVVFNFINLG